jgi:hypothetical protein
VVGWFGGDCSAESYCDRLMMAVSAKHKNHGEFATESEKGEDSSCWIEVDFRR